MRRSKVYIAVAVAVIALWGVIVVARGGAEADPFPPPPIVPPNEPGVLPDIETQPIVPVNRVVVSTGDREKPPVRKPAAKKEESPKKLQVVRVIPSFPNLGKFKKPPVKKKSNDADSLKPVEVPVPPPALPDSPKKDPNPKAQSNDGPPLPDFPMTPKKEPAPKAPPLPDFPGAPKANKTPSDAPPPPPVAPIGSLAPVKKNGIDAKKTPANQKPEPPDPMVDLAPKPAPMLPKKKSAPTVAAPEAKKQPPGLPKMPSVPGPKKSLDLPPPMEITPKKVEKKSPPQLVIEDPKAPIEDPEPVKPSRPAFQILVPLKAKRPSRIPSKSHKTVYKAPTVQTKRSSSKTPPLVIEKSGPGSALLGQAFYYEITVRNLGSTWAYGATVEDELPYGVRFRSAEPEAERDGKSLRWRLDIPPKSVRRFRIEVQPTAAGDWKNAARVFVSAKHTFVTSIQPTSLILRINSPATAELNDIVEFGIHITNSSGKDLTNLAITADLSPGLHHPAGASVEGTIDSLKSGDSTVVTLKTKAVQPASQSIHVRVKTPDGVQAESRARIKIGKSGLMLKMQAPRELDLNSEGDVIVDVVNLRSKPVRNVVVRSQLPAGLQYIAASDEGLYRKGTRSVDWLVPELEPGQIRRLALKVRADAPGEYAPIVTAHAESGSETTKRRTVNIEDTPNLSVEVRHYPGPNKMDAKKLYVVEVVNKGSMPATNVQLRAKLPEGLGLWQTTGPTLASFSDGVIVFQPLKSLAPGAKTAYGVTVIGRMVGAYHMGLQWTSDQQSEARATDIVVNVIAK